ncbi:response regulator transcription factor [Duganella caerulea]|uniref:response regulator transcription factor n=1 Tax=Duganella caerulea TaxID=2885762 RepID=UPI004037B235
MRLDTRNWSHAAHSGNGMAAGGAIDNHESKVRVLIAHSDAIVSAGLAALLGAECDMELDETQAATADVIILDYKGALEHMRQRANAPQHGEAQARVLIVTQMEREWEVRTAMMAGIHGYLLQNCAADQLLTAVRTLSRGMRYLSADLSRCVADSFTRINLTSRETDVLQLLAQGQCNKSIARELGIGVGTVKTHVKGLFDKLGATARTHAVVLATRRGLVGEGSASRH